MPITAFASSSELVVITASPFLGNGTCVYDFTIVVVSDYEIQFNWTPGNGTGTYIVGAYGRWPTSATDGFEVYNGNATSATHWVNTEFIGVNVYYKAYNDLGNGTYAACYASGSITGGAGVTAIGANIALIGTVILAFLALACMFGAYHFKNGLFLWGAAIFWLAFIGYAYLQTSGSGDTFWVLAGAGAMMMILSIAFMFGGMGRDKPALDETALQKYQKSETSKTTESMEDFKKRMGLKGKRNQNKYPWER
jgi:hypothetical protein